MKKFSKILESYDYSFGIKTQYISPNGHIYYKPDDDFAKGKIKVEKGLFKNKVTDVIIYKATLDIKILVEKDYGDD